MIYLQSIANQLWDIFMDTKIVTKSRILIVNQHVLLSEGQINKCYNK